MTPAPALLRTRTPTDSCGIAFGVTFDSSRVQTVLRPRLGPARALGDARRSITLVQSASLVEGNGRADGYRAKRVQGGQLHVLP